MAPTLDTAAAVIFSGLLLPCEVLPRSFRRIPAVRWLRWLALRSGVSPDWSRSLDRTSCFAQFVGRRA